MNFLLDALWRRHQQVSWYRRWFCIDKPARNNKAGAGPNGLFDHERSEATDKERAGMDERTERTSR